MRFALIIALLCSFQSFSQDSLRISLRQADSLFIKNNLILLAERFRIDAAQASVIQAKLWDNPTLSTEWNIYNPTKKQVLDVGRGGQKIISIEQVLVTAGKRSKQVALSLENARMTEYEFLDLLRLLKFELRSNFFDIFFLQNTLNRYLRQIETLQSTVAAFEMQYEKNNVSLRELLRLKALLFQLNNDKTEILFQLAEKQKTVKTLLNSEQPVKPLVVETELNRYRLATDDVASLSELALQNRGDVKVAESFARQAELNYQLQKALAVPNLRLGATYDQSGSYVNNYTGLTLGADLPFFNKNQGNIKVAKTMIEYQKGVRVQKQNAVTNEVAAALQKVRYAENMVQSVDSKFTEQFELLNKGVLENFQKRNLTLLEFIDLIETYSESIRELNRLKADRVGAYEELNFTVGQELFN
ncbi:TolC family protein [Runella slithyformis]|uniref:Outer membrane efflux protein n=1 Tax=Runella slithyformis (strain ATCC 29530 / DSM 19594 / LMG 11500 / NCIMB 11436 / LSU 4) TaxID=761193 RepID=A0A7U4E721_RUNSL|nr:TolC family protein [Runella slithyformis]AEI49914.1 outer membrane efflux protein [Runella slithyformis DSM 19594]